MPDPSNPQPTPDNPNPEPARPASPPEEPPTHEPPGVPSPSPDPVPAPDEPVQIPPWVPPEIPPTPGFPAPTARAGADLAEIASAFAFALRAFAFALFVSLPLLAGPTAAQPSDDGNGQLVDPCQARPQEDQDQQLRAAGQMPDDVLSESLERCHGVLKPPPTGDREIVEPAPDTGTTPIIPPGSLPEQPPK